MNMEENKCSFCDNKVIEEQSIYIGKYIILLYPRNPLSKRHFMILTKRHINSFSDLDIEELDEIRSMVDQLVKIFIEDIDYSGFNLINNNGPDAGQHVLHFHMHIFFRSKSEEYSPLDVLSKKISRKEFPKEEWKNNLIDLKKQVNINN